MPERPYRLRELHDHLARSPRVPADLELALRLHPDWPPCASGCGWPVDPAGAIDGRHPTCNTTTTASAEPADQ